MWLEDIVALATVIASASEAISEWQSGCSGALGHEIALSLPPFS